MTPKNRRHLEKARKRIQRVLDSAEHEEFGERGDAQLETAAWILETILYLPPASVTDVECPRCGAPRRK